MENRIKNIMNSYRSQSHSDFRTTLKNSLASTYPSYYFTVSVYNQASGWDNHGIKGYSYVSIWRQYSRNVAVTYVKKTSNFPSSSKRNEINNAVVNAITKKVRVIARLVLLKILTSLWLYEYEGFWINYKLELCSDYRIWLRLEYSKILE